MIIDDNLLLNQTKPDKGLTYSSYFLFSYLNLKVWSFNINNLLSTNNE